MRCRVKGRSPPPHRPFRPLNIGATGADVEMLQTVLIQKGFLTMPHGVAKGYFSKATRAALAHYQTSIGLKPVGVFGPLTRAKLMEESGGNLTLSSARTQITIQNDTGNSPTSRQDSIQSFKQSLKSLFDTPLDGLVSIFLFVGIIFMACKIMKRR